jgi:hypothetical protein
METTPRVSALAWESAGTCVTYGPARGHHPQLIVRQRRGVVGLQHTPAGSCGDQLRLEKNPIARPLKKGPGPFDATRQ